MNKYRSQSIAVVLILSGLTLAFSTNAQTVQRPGSMDPESLVDHVLCNMRLGCGSATSRSTQNTTQTETSAYNPASNSTSGGFFSRLFGVGGNNRRSSGVLYGSIIARGFTRNEITLVRVPRPDSVPGELKLNETVYEIIKGKKHLIPTLDIFYDYGFDPRQVQFITQEQLDKYTRIKLVKVDKDKEKGAVYYITDNRITRRVLSEDLIKSYGERSEDIITISKKEFNYYPENKYIYLDQPTRRDVYVISGNTKIYLTPMAVRRLEILASQAAPVNEFEFNAYKVGSPIIY